LLAVIELVICLIEHEN